MDDWAKQKFRSDEKKRILERKNLQKGPYSFVMRPVV